MTFAELVERAKRQMNAGEAGTAWPDSELDMSACVMQAQSQLAQRVMRDDALRSLLQQEYTLTLDSSGEGDLSAAVGSIAGDILLEGVRFGVVIDNDRNVLKPLRH